MDETTEKPKAGIVHLGLGAFFRAFGCIYVADAMAASGGEWGIVGVSLRSADVRDSLRPRNWAYTAVTMAPEGETMRDIEVLTEVLVAPEDPAAVLRAMADPAVKIVSLTVTEKGYCHDPATGAVNFEHPDIVHDLAHPMPVSAPGYILRALQMRHAAGEPPFTVLSCDNLPDNGALVRDVILGMAQRLDPALADWIAAHARFPATMVDRITPATTPSDITRISAALGFAEAAPVLHEPFCQWVVEDDFVGNARPDLAAAGAQMVADVSAHEHMKLRMLNGAHSALAYLGYLGGHDTIAQTVADPVYATYLRQLWSEVLPAVTPPAGVDLNTYADALFERFANPAIQHKTWQIAMDGSQKLPQRLLHTLAVNMEAGRPSTMILLAVAGWMRYAAGRDEAGGVIDVRDPMAERFTDIATTHQTPAEMVAGFLALQEVFSPELAKALRTPITNIAQHLWAKGARATMQEMQP
ncbi:mannitol dehydrogenase family protein [Sulfitobacter sp. HNIBRBA2951]|uniref:mannitol dehydrogenase family protein n=1 Tax=Sulfitobacter aquimarinus TaxID=3158557 RepID=UPI0032DF7A04